MAHTHCSSSCSHSAPVKMTKKEVDIGFIRMSLYLIISAECIFISILKILTANQTGIPADAGVILFTIGALIAAVIAEMVCPSPHNTEIING